MPPAGGGDGGRFGDQALAHKGPVLMEFVIDPDANVYPIVPLGKGLDDFTELPDEYA